MLYPRKLVSLSILISLGALLGVVGPARAQDTVKFEIEAPPGHPGLKVNTLTLYQGGLAGTAVASWSGLLFVSGAPASVSLPVTAVPDAYSAVYEIPFGGEPTDVLIDTAEFGFGTQYFMPNPSMTAVPVTTALPDSGGDAWIQLTLLPPPPFPDDDVAPTCDVTRNGLDIEATLRDVDSGLASIEVDFANNLTVTVPIFTVGATEVVVPAFVNDPTRLTTLLLDVRDQAGNRILCKSVTKHDGTSPGDVVVSITEVSAAQGVSSVPSLSGGAMLVLAAGLAATGLRRLRRR